MKTLEQMTQDLAKVLTVLREKGEPVTESAIYFSLFQSGYDAHDSARMMLAMISNKYLERVGRVAVRVTPKGRKVVQGVELVKVM